MLGRHRADRLEQAEGADEIGLDIAFGVVDGMAHARLRGQMDHRVGAKIDHQIMQHARCLDPVVEGAKPGILRQHRLPSLFQRDIVVIGHGVDAQHLPAGGQKLAAEVKADEAR